MYKLQKMPVNNLLQLKIIYNIPFLIFQYAKNFTKTTGLKILWKMQFSIISGHTVSSRFYWQTREREREREKKRKQEHRMRMQNARL